MIDLSQRGALAEFPDPLKPGFTVVLELSAANDRFLVPARVLRCQVAQLRPDAGVLYRAAFEFKKPIEIPASARWPDAQTGNVLSRPQQTGRPQELELTRIAHELTALAAMRSTMRAGGFDISVEALVAALTTPQAYTAPAADPFAQDLSTLLNPVLDGVTRGHSPAKLLTSIEDGLRRAVGAADIRIASGPAPLHRKDVESIYFTVPRSGGASGVLQVGFGAGCKLSPHQFRLLKTAAHLIGAIQELGDRPIEPSQRQQDFPLAPLRQAPNVPMTVTEPPGSHAWSAASNDVPPGGHKLVVRFLDGRMLKGCSSDLHRNRQHFHLAPSLEGPAGEQVAVAIAQLKAVFFVRSFAGNPTYSDRTSLDRFPPGRKIEVTFLDDEVQLGSTLNYRADGPGFFIFPADPQSNNLRILIMTAAVRHLRFF